MQQEIDYRKLGLRIKEIRISRGLSQDTLAELVGCNPSHISNTENAYTKPSLNVLISIANALYVTVDFLLSDQYKNTSSALDSQILKILKNCDISKKEKILKIIEIL